ncbi:MAG TPA: CBS domain-containing protein [Thermoanaerobaculia bacterium]|nr:CBS domain-containing protein [Thermoanaerobaculia bacterium]
MQKQAVTSMGRGSATIRRTEPKVRDLMTPDPYTLQPRDTLAALYDLMDSHRVRHVPIVDADGELVGLLTHTDLAMSALGSLSDLPLSQERDLLQRRRVREVMVTDLETVEPDTSLAEAAATLFENKIGCLPVVEGSRLVGILTESDFVRRFVEESAKTAS